MTFNDLFTRLGSLKDKYDNIVTGLVGIGIIDDYPEMIFHYEYDDYNVNSFRSFWNDFYLAKNRFNWLVTLTNENGFIDENGDLLDTSFFSVPDLIAGQDVIHFYDEKLSEIETTLNQLDEILIENNVLEGR